MPARAVQIAAALAVALAAMAMAFKGSGLHSATKANRTNSKVFECTNLGVGSRYLATQLCEYCLLKTLLARCKAVNNTFSRDSIVVCRYTVVKSTEDTKGDRLIIRELVRAGSPGMSSI